MFMKANSTRAYPLAMEIHESMKRSFPGKNWLTHRGSRPDRAQDWPRSRWAHNCAESWVESRAVPIRLLLPAAPRSAAISKQPQGRGSVVLSLISGSFLCIEKCHFGTRPDPPPQLSVSASAMRIVSHHGCKCGKPWRTIIKVAPDGRSMHSSTFFAPSGRAGGTRQKPCRSFNYCGFVRDRTIIGV